MSTEGAARRLGRIAFAVAWLGLQLALIFTAGRRADGAFGFRMFNESSTMHVALYREVQTSNGTVSRIHVEEGTWTARDASGTLRRISWYDRVRPTLFVFDREVHASYGAKAQLERLQAALDDVATHTPDDNETLRLLVDVTVRRNGRPWGGVVHLTSPVRTGVAARR